MHGAAKLTLPLTESTIHTRPRYPYHDEQISQQSDKEKMAGHNACPSCGASIDGATKTCDSCGSVRLSLCLLVLCHVSNRHSLALSKPTDRTLDRLGGCYRVSLDEMLSRVD
ncbi:hypothetical protein BJX64DRAFT_101912 [Aspergillus heterothallicus]